MSIQRFRKKPVEIEAAQFNRSNGTLVAEWCGGRYHSDADGYAPVIEILTFEGLMTASLGDWIIKGVQGEFYPCKPDIFEATYDPIV